jgi:uncharacterized protein YwgA
MRYEVKRPTDPRESAIDLALLAYILKGAAPFQGRTKLQKTTFLTELRLREHDLIGPRFRFYRYDNGPFSKNLLNAYDVLHAQGLTTHRDELGLTERGQVLADLVQMLKDEPDNREFFSEVDTVLETCRRRTGEQLMEEVYDLDVRPEGWTTSMKVRNIPKYTDIIVPIGRPTLCVPKDLLTLIIEELELTDNQIAEADKRLPDMIEDVVRNVMTERQRSA